MDYFTRFTSNCLAGSGNQKIFFSGDSSQSYESRIFFQIEAGGRYDYSFLYSNSIDSTFSDGTESYRNIICDSWKIKRLSVTLCSNYLTGSADMDGKRIPLTFSGTSQKTVMPGEFFATDPVELNPEDHQYLCLEMEFSGEEFPTHPETIVSSYLLQGDKWLPSVQMPFPSMIGCNRPVIKRIAFWGDSITQGIGTEVDSYKHWAALTARSLGKDYAYWDLGLGFGRASDAATGGSWFYKAKQNDLIIVCFGVNDLAQGMTEEQIKSDLMRIVRLLRQNSRKVVLQTIPPFDYTGNKIGMWNRINQYMKDELSLECDMVFDNGPVLRLSEDQPQNTKYGGHPNADGCRAWADALTDALKNALTDARFREL